MLPFELTPRRRADLSKQKALSDPTKAEIKLAFLPSWKPGSHPFAQQYKDK